MICVREPSDGAKVDGPLVTVATFDMVVVTGRGVDRVVVAVFRKPL